MSEESDIAVLQNQIKNLQKQVEKDERSYTFKINEARKSFDSSIQALEGRADSIEARIRTGRGIFIGIFFTLGTIGFTAADKISSAIMKYFG